MPANTIIGEINGWAGTGLCRPECVVAHQSGLLLVPNWTGIGGVSLINPSGMTHHILASASSQVLRPNGIALESGGTVLLAHMGNQEGGIFRLHHDGTVESVVSTANEIPLPPTNFVVVDSLGRLWITVSTRKIPRAMDYRRQADSGFIAVADPGSSNANIVADGLGYANECVVDEKNSRVFVNETFGRRLSMFTMTGGNDPYLSDRRLYCGFGNGMYPDGLALDSDGYLWVTSIVSNRIVRVAPDGQYEIVFEDSVQAHIDWTESAYIRGKLGREHLDTVQSNCVKNISNLAFAGKSRTRLYLGNLLGESLPYIESDSAGVAMTHWDVELGQLEQYL